PLKSAQTDLYVDLDKERGDGHVVQRLYKRITFGPRPTCQVLAGHKGSGKSTELLKLQQKLDTLTPKHFTVYFSVDEDLDRSDIDFPDLLLAIVGQMANQLRARAQIDLKPCYFAKRFAE